MNSRELKSLGLQTNLIFHRFGGEIIDRPEYSVVKTPSRPDYFWGNHLIFPHAPKPGDAARWCALHEKEIGPRAETKFQTFSWDDPNGTPGDLSEFVERGFEFSQQIVLTATSVVPPRKINPRITVRQTQSDRDWDRYDEIHFATDWEYGSPETQRAFTKREARSLRLMTEAGLGVRFGAALDGGELIADLGVYWDGTVARFNNVGTHRDFRRRGACGQLVFSAANWVLANTSCKRLVMVADPDYHAAKIYESLGFKPTEKMVELEWFDRNRF